MKTTLYKTFLYVCTGLGTLVLPTGCSEDKMDEINQDINHPTSVNTSFLITEVEMSTAFSVTGGDYSAFLSVIMEHEGGTVEQLYEADHRLFQMEDASNWGNCWGYIYNNLNACQDVINACSAEGVEANNHVNRGIARTMMAYNLAFLTDMHGDVPWSEALNFREFMTPNLDKQEAIYQDVMKLLDEALNDLAQGNATTLGAADLYYKGDAAKWTKAVYALKARYTMRLLGRSADRTGDLNKILDYVSKSFTSADEEMKLDKYDGASTYNPTYVLARSRDACGLSKSLMDKLISRQDPRASQIAINSDMKLITPSDPTYYPLPNGEGEKSQNLYSEAATDWAETGPTQLLSYHELLFLKAEAQARLGQDASETLKAAMAAAYVNLAAGVKAAINSTFKKKVDGECTLSASMADEHFEAHIRPLYQANPLQEVMIEKYLSFFGSQGESPEAFSDYRRMTYLGESFIKLANPLNAATTEYPKGHFPLRCAYGSGDTTTNPNVYEAQGDGSFVYSEPVWWAGGTR